MLSGYLQNFADREPDVADLAAACGSGILQSRPFVDGNKRAALFSVRLFLAVKGYRLVATPAEVTVAARSLAAGELEEPEFAAWLREHLVPRSL